MEFLRFGSSIPGAYWGCCAVDIIQNFKVSPSAPYAIQHVSGDGGQDLGDKFSGMTYEEVFENRLRVGTFNTSEMPNHIFLAVLTQQQVSGGVGLEWLKILKKHGFEFIRATDNSVYTGSNVNGAEKGVSGSHPNYLFGLFRNISSGCAANPYAPPAAWSDLAPVIPEAWHVLDDSERKSLAIGQRQVHTELWKAGATKWFTKAQVIAKGIIPTMAGQRSKLPQEPANVRETKVNATDANPFAKVVGAAKAALG